MRPYWYLCAVNIAESDKSEAGEFHVDFFWKHPTDENKKDNLSRFWPDLYESKWSNKGKSCWDYRRCILVRPNSHLNLAKHSRYSVTVDFTGENKLLVGPFNFVPKLPGVAGNQYIDDIIWEQLSIACHHHGLVPPDLSSDPVTCVNTTFVSQDSNIMA